MSQQGLRQASVRAVSGTTLSYEGDWHAMWNGQGIAAGSFNERMMAYATLKTGTTYTNVSNAMQALAAAAGATNFGSMGTFSPALTASTGASALLGSETDGLAFAASDDTMEIRDTVTPANNYVGAATTKFGSVRASAAYQTLGTGSLGWALENGCLQSQTLDSATWSKSAATVTANAIVAPDGTTTADKIVESATTANHFLQQNVTTVVGHAYVVSYYAKAGERTFIAAIVGNSGDRGSYVNLTTGAVGSDYFAGVTVTTQDALNGWWRIKIAFTAAATSTTIYLFLANSDGTSSIVGNGTSGAYFWGGMLSHGTTPGTYVATTTSPYYGLRRDFDDRLGVGIYGFWTETARTNLCLYSNDMTQSPTWETATGWVVPVANSTTAPDGTTTACKVTPDTNSGVGHTFWQMITTTAAAHTVSWYYKPNGYTKIGIRESTATGAYVTFNCSGAGTIMDSSTATGTILALSNGWYRCTATITMAAGSTKVHFCTADASYTTGPMYNYLWTGNGTSGGYWWCNMVELGPNASSPIPTGSAAATRAADIVSFTGFNWTTATVTLYAKYMVPVNSGTQYIFSQNTRACELYLTSGTPTVYQDTLGLVTSGSTPAVLTTNKIAVGGALNSFASSLNGAAVVQDTATSAMLAATTLNVGHRSNVTQLDGWILDGVQLPRRMTNAELVTRAT